MENSGIPKYLEIKIKKLSRSQERRLKVQLDKAGMHARVQAGSGSLWGAKGDVRTKDELWEHKGTTKTQMVVKEEWLKKIFGEAVHDSRIPCICLEFKGFKVKGYVEKKLREQTLQMGMVENDGRA